MNYNSTRYFFDVGKITFVVSVESDFLIYCESATFGETRRDIIQFVGS